MGAMSFPNEGLEVWAETVAGDTATAKIQPTATQDRIIAVPPR
jgi:hypothetical protein